MFFWDAEGDGGQLLLGLLIGTLVGALCGAAPLTVGLIRGHKQMAWTGFGVSILLGIACWPIALIPAIIFTIIVAVTEPIEARRKKKRANRRRRRDRADDFLEHGEKYDDRPRRRRVRDDDDEYEDEDDDDRPRRRGRVRLEEDEDDEYDRPRRRRRARDDDD